MSAAKNLHLVPELEDMCVFHNQPDISIPFMGDIDRYLVRVTASSL